MNHNLFLISAYERGGYAITEEVIKHLKILERTNKISFHTFFDVPCGTSLQEYTMRNFEESSIILLLIDANYFADKHAYQYQQKALESGKPIIPVILTPCFWEYDENLKIINSRPKFKGITKPISEWKTKDGAYKDVIMAIIETIKLIEDNYDFKYKINDDKMENRNRGEVSLGIISSNKEKTMKDVKYFNNLLAEGKIQQLIQEWLDVLQQNNEEDLHGNILLVSSRYNRNEEKSRKQTISEAEYNLELNRITNSIRDYLKEFKSTISNPNTSKLYKKVFISYNHKDKQIADSIKIELEKAGITVTIDSEDMVAGDDIKRFIEESIKNTSVTLSLVSPNSLMSAWVAMESMNTFYAQKVVEKQFIATFIDPSFFKRDFVDKTLNKIDKETEKIKKSITNRLAKNRNITDLQTELERYNDLTHNLPKIIQRLKDSLSVNIVDENFDSGIVKIIQSIKS